MDKHASIRYRCMSRTLALSTTFLLLSMTAVATPSQPPAPARYSLQLTGAEAPPAVASRYQVRSDAAIAPAAGRFRLLGTGITKAGAELCDSADGLFANDFES